MSGLEPAPGSLDTTLPSSVFSQISPFAFAGLLFLSSFSLSLSIVVRISSLIPRTDKQSAPFLHPSQSFVSFLHLSVDIVQVSFYSVQLLSLPVQFFKSSCSSCLTLSSSGSSTLSSFSYSPPPSWPSFVL